MCKRVFLKQIFIQFLILIFVLSGCMSSDLPSGNRPDQLPEALGATTSGIGAGADKSGIGGGISLPPKVEIRHLIEPNLSYDTSYSTGTGQSSGGSYLRKMTLPKNFAGRIYLAGINFGSLSDKHVKVRFKFGLDQEPVTLPATVSRAPGITPQTDISVLVMDLRSEPFRNIRLPYDLFDYNEYQTNPDGTFTAEVEPVQDNRNSNLYCRGLKLMHDPTFEGVGACDQVGEECLYAYAKVRDQGLNQQSGGIKLPLSPSYPQIGSSGGGNYYEDDAYEQLKKPLLDMINVSVPNTFSSYKFGQDIEFNDWSAVTILGSDYYYRGPYRLVNRPNWEFGFPFSEIHGKNKLFRENSWVSYPFSIAGLLPDDDPLNPEQNRLYYHSYLFPLATKLDLNANVSHLSSDLPDGERIVSNLSNAGETKWMDGANARAQSRNSDLEHIGSCNVSATIEILARDESNTDYVIATANDVKLQLVRPTQYQTDSGDEVLYSNFKTCNNNAGCASSECCFNNRCWDENLISQCVDDTLTQGNKNVGESCSSDLQCTSLCCNSNTGQCSPHNTISSPAVLCSKPIGGYCIAKEWCQKTFVTKCIVINTGTDAQGNPTCNQLCYNEEVFGDCKNGRCTPPPQEPIPVFDPDDPSACDNAVDPPNFGP